jgi:heterodisulfide reductase subunit B
MRADANRLPWRDFQKEIAEDRYFFVRSCIRQNFFPGAEQAFLRILKENLGKDIHTDPRHTTCTGIAYHVDLTRLETTMTVIARQFALMNEAGYENMVISCVTSFGLYNEVLELWEHHPELEARIRDYLYRATGREFRIPENMVHASDILYRFRQEIADRSPYRLVNPETGQPLSVIDHIGCHYARMFPYRGVGGAEYPQVLAGLAESLGGRVVDYPERRMCCGFGFRQYFIRSNRGYSLSCMYRKMKALEPCHPDLILTNCPGCNLFFDRWQYVIGEQTGETFGQEGAGIPVLSHEELAALCLGYDPWDIGLQMHQVSVEPLLDKMGVRWDKKSKYTGPGGIPLAEPEIPEIMKVW